ncbi:MAG: prolipoprotein diacylglyceryl transferase [Clostridia bacterium]|nr:prolipoprotein diacylglyceryl transferase [Clostridia bacterium]
MQERLLFGFIPIYGVLITLAIALGVCLCLKQEKRMGLPTEISIDFALWAVPAAVIGARLYYVAFQWPLYAPRPLRILYIWEGGLAIYGGVIGGAVGAWLFSRSKRIPFGALADLVAPALILGQAIGRWGNFFNQEAFGQAIENPAFQFFPAAVYVEGVWHMATFFYESAWDFCGFLLLWRLRKKITARGNLFFLYLCWYGLGRAFIEGLRTDSLMWGSVRVSQALSVLLCAISLIILILRHRKHKGEHPYPLSLPAAGNERT